MQINFDGLTGNLDFAVMSGNNVLMAGIFERSKTKAKALGCQFGHSRMRVGYQTYGTRSDNDWNVSYMRIPLGGGRDHFWYVLATSGDIGDSYIVTSGLTASEDLYNFLMKNYKLPLLKEWTHPIWEEARNKNLVKKIYPNFKFGNDSHSMLLQGQDVSLRDLDIYEVSSLTEDSLQSLVSEMLRKKIICITERDIPEMKFESFDDYIERYGGSLVKSLEKEINPLCELKGSVDSLALKTKRLFPQQGACVNGIIALKKSGVKYGILNEGMGVGKTIQALSVVDGYFAEDYLQKHPDKELKDAYQQGALNYRNIVIAPGHLTEKWAEEIKQEIPHAKVTILRDFSQLVRIREAGIKRTGKEFFILSKDFAKLGSQISPIPTQVKTKYITAHICRDCLEEEGIRRYLVKENGKEKCPTCGGTNKVDYSVTGLGKWRGLVCHNCGNLVLNTKNLAADIDKIDADGEKNIVLGPKDFAKHTSANAMCYLCNTSLWGVNVKPLVQGAPAKIKAPKWRKISHFKNAHKKSKETAFVLKGHEDEYLWENVPNDDAWDYLASDYGPRKTAPSGYIKKYLKGYFDFAILDECHKFEGAGTAQANAAQALITASSFTLGLTGTISNGSAGSFFWLLYMLEPSRLKQQGYDYSAASYMRFCKTYGSIETVYEYSGNSIVYNSNSRGRQLTQPKVRPGISPMLYVDFLLDRCVMLDITDLSKYLPPLKEQVITCELPRDIAYSYRSTIEQLKEATHTKEGRGCLAAMLNFGLAYPDKPYQREHIYSAFDEGEVIASVTSYDEYVSLDRLLPKEEKMVEIINSEMAEGRNVFVYASFTGEAENNITYRLQQVIEKYCNLKGRVQIIQASSPEASKREAFIKKKAADGVRVFITNPKCVETGLDFCFKHEGKSYNYPTLIFMQMSYEMSVIWQASRRSYRLNQREECRTYYLAYENTLQTAALEIMAAKQVATSAIQGKFSSEGLAAMAKGVDTRTQLATALAKNDMSDANTLAGMFDVLNQQNNASDDLYNDYVPPKTYYELVGIEDSVEESYGISAIAQTTLFDDLSATLFNADEEEKSSKTGMVDVISTIMPSSVSTDDIFADMFNNDLFTFSSVSSDCASTGASTGASTVDIPVKPRSKKPKMEGQLSLIEMLIN